jgi:hypothetical protein
MLKFIKKYQVFDNSMVEISGDKITVKPSTLMMQNLI